jgi:LmbE family N-acetylglucosaminyl deacetylase
LSLLPWFAKKKRDDNPFNYGDSVKDLPPLGADGPLTLMAIMAHPDDIDFGSAGSIAKWCAEGWTVYYVLATSGDKGTHDPSMTGQELAAIREEEQREAGRSLGVKECIFLGYPDGFVFPTSELRGQIVRLFRQYKPDVVLTWDGFRSSFNHIDHRNIGIAVRDAVYPATRDRLYYAEHEAEGLPEHRVNEMLLSGSDRPDYFVDISAFIEKKVDAMLAHKSQVSTQDRDEMRKSLSRRGGRQGRGGMVESFKRVHIGSSRPKPDAVKTQESNQTPAGAQP